MKISIIVTSVNIILCGSTSYVQWIPGLATRWYRTRYCICKFVEGWSLWILCPIMPKRNLFNTHSPVSFGMSGLGARATSRPSPTWCSLLCNIAQPESWFHGRWGEAPHPVVIGLWQGFICQWARHASPQGEHACSHSASSHGKCKYMRILLSLGA